MVLNKAGNSNAEERTDLMAKLNNVFPDQPMRGILKNAGNTF